MERFSFRKLASKDGCIVAFYHSRQLHVNRPQLPPSYPYDTRAPLVIPNLQQAWPVDRKGDGENENDCELEKPRIRNPLTGFECSEGQPRPRWGCVSPHPIPQFAGVGKVGCL